MSKNILSAFLSGEVCGICLMELGLGYNKWERENSRVRSITFTGDVGSKGKKGCSRCFVKEIRSRLRGWVCRRVGVHEGLHLVYLFIWCVQKNACW